MIHHLKPRHVEPTNKRKMSYYQTPGGGENPDKLVQVQTQAEDLRGTLQITVEKAIERGTHIEELDITALRLENSANRFRTHAISLKWKMCWQNYRLWLLLVVLLLVVVLILLAVFGAFK